MQIPVVGPNGHCHVPPGQLEELTQQRRTCLQIYSCAVWQFNRPRLLTPVSGPCTICSCYVSCEYISGI
uniref:Uncharacterized protein n=1 Tax=Equus asinus asinus TaxID=83772 RepID=A0A8C4LZX3_EQUAS